MAPQLQCLYPEAKQSRLHLVWPKCLCCLIAKWCPTLCDPWAIACQAPLSMGFLRQECWNGLPFPSSEDLPNPGIESSTLAWRIPWTKGPGRLQSMGSWRVGQDCETSLSLFTFMHWRRKWQPTPVFLPGESQGRGSLVGCHLWGRTESDTTEAA